MAHSGVDVEFTPENFAIIRMKRGQNRVNPEFVAAFSAALDKVEGNPSCRAVIITGEGRHFSTGFDIPLVRTFPEVKREEFFRSADTFFNRILTFPMPTVAAMNGHAFAGGAFLAIACDFRIMRTDLGWISWNEIFVKIRFPEFFLELLRSKVPSGSPQLNAAVFGKRFTADEAVANGIVDEAASEDMLLPKSKSLLLQALGRQPYDREMFKAFKEDVYSSAQQALNKKPLKSLL